MDLALKQPMLAYIAPFLSLLSFLQAISVVNRLYCNNKKNYKQIQETITQLITSITLPEAECFINKVVTYCSVYPIDFFAKITEFNLLLTNHMSITNEHTYVLESPAMKCNNCHKGKEVLHWFEYKSPPLGKDAILYTRESILKCVINIKKCKYCSVYHYMSFSMDLKRKNKKYFHNAHTHQYFQYTTETIFENKLMISLLADIIFKHTSFRAFADTYNYLNISQLPFRFLLNAKRLADAFFCYELCRFYNNHMPYLLTSMHISYN